ncbi:MAG: hypothetical protein QM532_00390 [Cyanobium sp. MAG06]|nr:hypothetical protein [Cyanobium sp. MAG06]
MGSLSRCKDLINKDFIVLMGDDIYSKSDLENLTKYDNVMLLKETDAITGGVIYTNNDKIVGIKEGLLDYIKDGEIVENKYLNTGALKLSNKDIFYLEMILVKDGEYGLPHTLIQDDYLNKNKLSFHLATK